MQCLHLLLLLLRPQDSTAAGPLLTSTLQKSNSLSLKLFHKTPAALAVSNSLAAAMRRYCHQLQQQQAAALVTANSGCGVRGRPLGHVVAAATVGGVDAGHAAPPAAAVVPAAAWSGPSGVDQLHLMAVRSRLAQLIAWRDAAARAGVLAGCFLLATVFGLSMRVC
jgi:hypothetical protein